MDSLLERFRRTRRRSEALFDLLTDDARASQPIALRHPVIFYEGHLPAFAFNTLVRRQLGGPAIDARLETLFARGIDPDERTAERRPSLTWPSEERLRAFVEECERRIEDAFVTLGFNDPSAVHRSHPRGVMESVFTIIEHEALHQETLMYMWHRVPLADKRRPKGYAPQIQQVTDPLRVEWCDVPEGVATLGASPSALFGWDNEFPSQTAPVPAFRMERWNVTNARYQVFLEDGGYTNPSWWTPEDWEWVNAEGVRHPLFWECERSAWYWRGMFDRLPLPASWPVYVTYAEASAFAKWAGLRLMTEAEFHRAAFGSPGGERAFPWGDDKPERHHGAFDWATWDPTPVGSHPRGASAWGIEDLIGNGWEWTSTLFEPFPGFRPMTSYPEYSADFFDGQHIVMKGASPVTDRMLIRASFRNWFRPRYPYVYATFRCVAPLT